MSRKAACLRVLSGVVLVVAALAVPGSGALGSPDAATTQVEVAKTRRYVHVFGDAPDGAEKVRVRLLKRTSDGAWTRRAVTSGRIQDGGFKARLQRPKRGECLARAIIRNGRGTVIGRGEEQFPCYIPPFGTTTARLEPTDGTPRPVHEIGVLVADDDAERGHGLMYRKWLAEDKGMVFLFEEQSQGGFYMLNTLIPLSIAFFDAEGTIVDILDMEPCPDSPCPTYTPDTPYSGALEVNQGAFERWGVREGDRITVHSN